MTKQVFVSHVQLLLSRVNRLSVLKKIIIISVAVFAVGGEFYNFQNSAGTYVADQESATQGTTTPALDNSATDTSPTQIPTPTSGSIADTKTSAGTILGAHTTVVPLVSQTSSQTSTNALVTPTNAPTATPIPTDAPTTAPTNTPAPVDSPTATPVVQQVTVTISQIGTYQTPFVSGQKACAVTSTVAAANGLTLDIRHDTDMNTDSIWVINGIGNPNSLWWTYKVNGVSPVWGCSHPNSPTIKAGDTISWDYIGP